MEKIFSYKEEPNFLLSKSFNQCFELPFGGMWPLGTSVTLKEISVLHPRCFTAIFSSLTYLMLPSYICCFYKLILRRCMVCILTVTEQEFNHLLPSQIRYLLFLMFSICLEGWERFELLELCLSILLPLLPSTSRWGCGLYQTKSSS